MAPRFPVLSEPHFHAAYDFNRDPWSSPCQDARSKLIIVMVGLPARGKSYITKKLCRYLNWLQYETKIFNVGDRRRELVSPSHSSCETSREGQPAESVTEDIDSHSAKFFDPENEDARRLREKVAMETLDELLNYMFVGGGSVTLFDATNTTRERRERVLDRIRERHGSDFPVLFLESQCFDEKLLGKNMRLKLSGPDYKNQDAVKALQDFAARVDMYAKKYEPLGSFEETEGYSFCQMIDVGRKLILHNVTGFLASQTVQYLQHFHLKPRQIWLTRHGQSYDDVVGRIGGDADLTMRGNSYAKALAGFIEGQRRRFHEQQEKSLGASTTQDFQVWTSNMPCSVQTSQFFNRSAYRVKHLKMLAELNAGLLKGLTRDEIKEFYSDWFETRQKDKFQYRYPGSAGEGYLDVASRLKSVILEVERMADHVLLISGLAVTRMLMAYFKGLKRDEIADLPVPLGTLYMLEPKPYGVECKEFTWDPITRTFSETRTNKHQIDLHVEDCS